MSTITSTFKLYKSLIYETVKNETHIAAHVARAMDKNAAELAFQEEAGDESYHERKLERSLYSSLDKIKAEIIDYLNTESNSSSDLTCTIGDEEITISITLSSRFNTSYLTPLADLVSKYVEDSMLFEWWTPINANSAKMYSEKAEIARLSILKCFIKKAPSKSKYSYANITGSTSSIETITLADVYTIKKGVETDISITLTGGLTYSDLTAKVDDGTAEVTIGESYVTINAANTGTLTLFVYKTTTPSVNTSRILTVTD